MRLALSLSLSLPACMCVSPLSLVKAPCLIQRRFVTRHRATEQGPKRFTPSLISQVKFDGPVRFHQSTSPNSAHRQHHIFHLAAMLLRCTGRAWPGIRFRFAGFSFLSTTAGMLALSVFVQIICCLHVGATSIGLTSGACAGPVINDHPCNNVSPSVAAKIGKDLHRRPAHPLGIIKERYASRCAPRGGSNCQRLALAARWYIAASSFRKGSEQDCPILEAKPLPVARNVRVHRDGTQR